MAPVIPNAAPNAPRKRAPAEVDRELGACNAAFDDLELDRHGTPAEMRDLAGIDGEKAHICAYLRLHCPHLLKGYDAEALAARIVEVEDRLRARVGSRWRLNRLAKVGRRPRPGRLVRSAAASWRHRWSERSTGQLPGRRLPWPTAPAPAISDI